ncbi:hypothetical protein DM791_16145 [Paenarthrobacter nitroguajacolicus]|nr:hypothetical protein [Paenarthrobacter nitroguajacolicus]
MRMGLYYVGEHCRSYVALFNLAINWENCFMEDNRCRVYWGSHGCHLARGHESLHTCDCCECDDHLAHAGVFVDEDGDEVLCVASWPYYGPATQFYGEDSPSAAVAI